LITCLAAVAGWYNGQGAGLEINRSRVQLPDAMLLLQGVLGEGTLGYKVMLSIYREKAPWFPGLESCWSW